MDVGTIISLVFGVLTIVFGGFWLKGKNKLVQIKNLIKEGADVVLVAVEAVGDDKLTTEEIAAIKKEAQEAVAAFKALIGR
ncbi:MAG TPA: hypothetical protein ENH85_02250 [Candidatus Scalindua sp.]|nr:hypothetical protein [Candidatus Scalindua sp.]